MISKIFDIAAKHLNILSLEQYFVEIVSLLFGETRSAN